MNEGELQAQAWKEWLESEKGRLMTAGHAGGNFLTNRLWWAFMAGYEAGKKAGTK